MGIKVAAIAAAVSAGLVILAFVIKSRRGGGSFIAAALEGLAALCAVNLAGTVTGVTVAVNWYTLGAAVLCGLPGVISILTLDFLFR